MPKIAVAGAGYVGISLAILLSRQNDVVVFDVVKEKIDLINAGKSPVQNKDLEDFIATKPLHLKATTDGRQAYKSADYVIVAVPTNYDEKLNALDTLCVEQVIELVLEVNPDAIIVIKSTVPVGYTKSVRERYDIKSILFSPEFLRENTALSDILNPDRIVVGTNLEDIRLVKAAHTFAKLLQQGATKQDIPTLFMNYSEAEAVKLFANAYLAMRVSFFNELDTFAEVKELDTASIIKGVSLDSRIGDFYNKPGFGYGGSCLPKDTKQLLSQYQGIPEKLISAVVESNSIRTDFIAERIIKKLDEAGKTGKSSTVGIYWSNQGNCFRKFAKNPVWSVVERLKEKEMEVIIYGPEGKSAESFSDCIIENDLDKFKQYTDLIISDRYKSCLDNVRKKVYIRDLLFFENKAYPRASISLTTKEKSFLDVSKPKNAIILAAGYGLRMVPINQNKPKALLTVDGQPLIERQIEQLQQVGIIDITIVVGFMKEAFDYLTEKYNVKLVYNKDYAIKNNLHSLACVSNKISYTYIVPCDLYALKNPFDKYEHYSWYMVNELIDENSLVRVTRTGLIDYSKNQKSGNTMTGIAYINADDALILKDRIKELCADKENDNEFWETALFEKTDIEVAAKVVKSTEVVEINSYEQLRDLDCYSTELQNESISVICKVFGCSNEDIKDINTLKKGMTNRSYIFSVKDKRYIMRIPGEGTEQLINRKDEAEVYNTIKGYNICDELFYINPANGMKISAFVEKSRCCDSQNEEDLQKCMKKLRDFHNLKLKVNHEFNIYEKIDFYESLWTEKSIFQDYEQTKKNALSLKSFIDSCKPEYCLTHIDAVPDNFLFSTTNGKEEIQLIDWEYAGMQDPHVDIAMFCIYSLYTEKAEIDRLIDFYFEGKCTPRNRIKIYCYVALCGLLWSNWCEYKRQLGVEFGEYSLMQYRYAKDYFKIATEEMKKLGAEK